MAEQTGILPKWLKPRRPAWLPVILQTEHVQAIRAVWAGEGTPQQQRLALEWVIFKAAEYGEVSFRSDKDGGDRETSFALGRQHVGQQLLKCINLTPKQLADMRKQDAAGTDSDPRYHIDPDKHAKSGS